MNNIKILGVIISFNPDISRLYENIKSLENQVEEILIIDNLSDNIVEINNIISDFNNLNIIYNKDNLGIAVSLNIGLEYAKNSNYNWILTMDQDSVCQNDMISKYRNFIKLNKEIDKYMILAPYILYENKEISNLNSLGTETDVVITSGSLVNVKNAIEISGFDENLFIDYVDFEFCLKAVCNNFKIVKIYGAYLDHRLGELEEKKIINKRVCVTNHSALRRYYMYRNGVYVWKKYILKKPKWVIRNIFSNIKLYLIILIFENDKKDKTKKILNGLKDGLLNNLGVHKF